MKKFKEYLKKQKDDPAFAKDYELVLEETRLEMIGELLRDARKEAGLSQEALAELTHTKRSAISRMERHASDMKLSTLSTVSKALGKKLQVSFR